MYEIARQLMLRAPPARVWRTLLDFEAYPSWTSAVVVEGEAKVGRVPNFSVWVASKGGKPWPMTIRTRVTDIKLNERFAWRMSSPVLMQLSFSYELAPHVDGSALRLRARLGGVIPHVMRKTLERLIGGAFDAMAAGLQRRHGISGRLKPRRQH